VSYCLPLFGIHLKFSVFFAGYVILTYYLPGLLEISLNNATIPVDWKKATVVPIYKGGDQSAVSNYRPISLTSVVCKQLEHIIAGYLRQGCDKKDLVI